MKKVILMGVFITLFITGCTTSIGLGAGKNNLSTSVSVEKEIKKDKKEVKNVKKNKGDTNIKKKPTEKRIKQIREDAIEKNEMKNGEAVEQNSPRTKQARK